MQTIFKVFQSRVFLTLLIMGLCVLSFGIATSVVSGDVFMLLTGGKIFADGNTTSLYDLSVQQNVQLQLYEEAGLLNKGVIDLLPFRYLPITALVLFPLTLVPHFQVIVSLFIWNVLLLFLSVFVIFDAQNQKLGLKFFYALILALLYYYTPYTLVVGHPFYLLLFVSSIFYFFKKGKWFEMGIVTSLLMLKPHYLVFAPFLFVLSKEKVKFLSGLLVSLVVLWGVNVYLYGFDLPFDYFSFLTKTESAAFGSPNDLMLSFAPALQVLFGITQSTAYAINSFVYLLFFGLIYFVVQKKGKSTWTLFVASLIFSFYLSPHLFEPDLLMLIVPLVLGTIRGKDYDIFGMLLIMSAPILRIHSAALAGVGFLLIGFYYLFDLEIEPKVSGLRLHIEKRLEQHRGK